jgi:NADPH:quinone reductase-like Zn-dependent oxidoreductase
MGTMGTMRAVRIHSYGEPDVLVFEDAPMPKPGEGEVLVRVHATSVNPFDWKVRRGYLAAWFNHQLPLILGWDLSGVVEATGLQVDGLQNGDEVYGMADASRNGAYAEYIVVRASHLARKPHSVDHLHAAAVPQAALTAWQALFDAGGLQAGQRVLIHAAAGGVGHFAVQFAKLRGAYVIGTASARNADFVRSLGADEVIDYTTTPFEEAARDIDVVIDTVGGDTQARSWKTLKPGGILVSIVEPPSAEMAAEGGARMAFMGAQQNAGQLEEIARLIDEGKVKPTVSTVVPLQEVKDAHTMNEGRHTRGKIVMTVA